MFRFALFVVSMLAIMLAPAGLAQDAEKPTVAILRFGPHLSYSLVEFSLLDYMVAIELITEEEKEVLRQGGELDGEHIRIIRGDANFDFANINSIVEAAIDQGADALISFSTPVTQVAALVTAEMDDPPVVLFAAVYDPIAAGIADSLCIKPDHITGVETITRYDEILPLLQLQDPDIQIIGALYSSSETSGTEGAKRIVEAAEALGLEVQLAAVTSVADIPIATESLLENGAEALLITSDMVTASGLPALMQVATEHGVPAYHAIASTLTYGVTVAAGSSESTLQGHLIGAILAGHLDGSVDIAKVGIALVSNLTVGVNLDTAESQGISISAELLAMADTLVQDGTATSARLVQVLQSLGLDEESIELVIEAASNMETTGGLTDIDLPEEVQAILQMALSGGERAMQIDDTLAGLRCTPEMIAEQQAALDAEQ